MTMELQSIAGQSAMKYALRINTEAEDAAKTTKEQEASNASSASGSSESSKTANTAATLALLKDVATGLVRTLQN